MALGKWGTVAHVPYLLFPRETDRFFGEDGSWERRRLGGNKGRRDAGAPGHSGALYEGHILADGNVVSIGRIQTGRD
jgi:hypothetical protein